MGLSRRGTRAQRSGFSSTVGLYGRASARTHGVAQLPARALSRYRFCSASGAGLTHLDDRTACQEIYCEWGAWRIGFSGCVYYGWSSPCLRSASSIWARCMGFTRKSFILACAHFVRLDSHPFAVHAIITDGSCSVPAVFSRSRICSVTSWLLEVKLFDIFLVKSHGCAQ